MPKIILHEGGAAPEAERGLLRAQPAKPRPHKKNDQVDAVDDAISVNEDATTANLAASLLLNDSDPDTSDVIRITGVTQGAKGSVVFNDGGTPTNPADDTLTYRADGAVLDALAAGEFDHRHVQLHGVGRPRLDRHGDRDGDNQRRERPG